MLKNFRWQFILITCLVSFTSIYAQKKKAADASDKLKTQAIADIQSKYDDYKKIALQIWGYAEVGYQEKQSSALHQSTLSANGFTLLGGVAEIPTAFVATYGSGKPVIGILCEFDALPGLSQDSVPEKKSLGKTAGHA